MNNQSTVPLLHFSLSSQMQNHALLWTVIFLCIVMIYQSSNILKSAAVNWFLTFLHKLHCLQKIRCKGLDSGLVKRSLKRKSDINLTAQILLRFTTLNRPKGTKITRLYILLHSSLLGYVIVWLTLYSVSLWLVHTT